MLHPLLGWLVRGLQENRSLKQVGNKINNMRINLKSITLLIVAAALIIGCKKKTEEILPTSNFSFDGTSKRAPQTVMFTNTSTDAVSYAWDFGDGTSSTEESPKHQYKNGGAFTVSLTSKNQTGKSNILSKQMIVLPSPAAIKSSSITVRSLKEPNFSGSAGYPKSYYFKIDGYLSPEIAYPVSGNPSITLTVPIVITPLSLSKEIKLYHKHTFVLMGSAAEESLLVATYQLQPSIYVQSTSETPYPAIGTINTDGSNFDLALEWY